MSSYNRNKSVCDDDICAFVLAEKRCSCQVVELRKIRSSVPLDRKLCKLVQRPGILFITASKFIQVKIRFDRVGVNVERLCKKIFSLLRIVLGLQRIVQNFLWADTYSVSGVCHFVNNWICIVDISIFIRIRAAHENKILFVFDCAIKNLSAILQTLP